MKLTYIYHSGFLIEGDNITIIIDYWKDPANIIPRILKNRENIYVLSTHFHPDHFTSEVLRWRQERPDIKYILSKDILRRRRAAKEDALFLGKGAKYNDDNISVEAFGSTDVGVSWYIEAEGKKIFHAGDLNNWHWQEECPLEESLQYEKAYLGELKDVCKVVKFLDLAMFPVDARLGKEYMRGPRQFLERIPTALFAPMHFTTNPIERIQAFKPIAESLNTKFFVIEKEGDTISF